MLERSWGVSEGVEGEDEEEEEIRGVDGGRLKGRAGNSKVVGRTGSAREGCREVGHGVA